jgi:hypothetical protein
MSRFDDQEDELPVMRVGAWLWCVGLVLGVIASGAGWLIRISPVLVIVPSLLFTVVAGAFCVGRPGLVTNNRVLTCVFSALLVLVAVTNFPFRLLFLASRNDLERTAQQVAGGRPCSYLTTGCFELSDSQVTKDGNVCLWTEADPDQKIGFVKTSAPKVMGALHELDLGGGWRYVQLRSE